MSAFRITRRLANVVPRCRAFLRHERPVADIPKKWMVPEVLTPGDFNTRFSTSSGLSTSPDTDPDYVYMTLHGIPYNSDVMDIQTFCDGIPVQPDDVMFCYENPGGFRRKPYCIVKVKPEYVHTLQIKDKDYIGSRYIQVERSTEWETNVALLSRDGRNQPVLVDKDQLYMKLKGLPFRCTETEVLNFIGVPVCGQDGVLFDRDADGRKTGFAYVLIDRSNEEEIMKKDLEYLGTRFVNMARATDIDLTTVIPAALRRKDNSQDW